MRKFFKIKDKTEEFMYRLLIWFNQDAKLLLRETKQRFLFDLKQHLINTSSYSEEEIDEKMQKEDLRSLIDPCYFFGDFEPTVSKEEVVQKWREFKDQADQKSLKRDGLIKYLLTVTFISLSFILVGVQALPLDDRKKLTLSVLLAILGILFTRSMKNRILATRASAYKYHLYKIYLELRYAHFLVPWTLRNRSQRKYKNKDIPYEDREMSLTNNSATDDELVIVSLARYLFVGSIFLSFIIAKGIPFIDFPVFGYVLWFV